MSTCELKVLVASNLNHKLWSLEAKVKEIDLVAREGGGCKESPRPGASTIGLHWTKARRTKIDISFLKSEVVTPKDEEIALTIIVNEWRICCSTRVLSEYPMEDFCEVSRKEKMTYVNKLSGGRELAPSTLWIEGVSSIPSEIKSQLMPTFFNLLRRFVPCLSPWVRELTMNSNKLKWFLHCIDWQNLQKVA